MKNLFLILLLSSPFFGLAQLTAEDSISIEGWKDTIDSDMHDSLRFKCMSKWKWKIMYADYKLDSLLNFEMLGLATENLKKNLNADEEKFFLKAKGHTFMSIGSQMMDFGKFDLTISYMDSAIFFFNQAGVEQNIDGCYINKGHALFSMSMYPEAIEVYNKGIDLTYETGNTRFRSYALMNLGACYGAIEEPELALKYYFEALETSKELNDNYGIGRCYLNLGSHYYALGMRDSSIYYFRTGIAPAKTISDYGAVMQAYSALGDIYTIEGQLDSAEFYFMKSLELQKLYMPRYAQADIYSSLGQFYGKSGDFKKALEYATIAYELTKESGDSFKTMGSLGTMHQANAFLGNYKMAYEQLQEYVELYTDQTTQDNVKEILNIELESEYEKEKMADSLVFVQEQAIKEMEHEKDLEAEALQRYILYIGLLGVLGLGVFAYIGYRRKRADNAIISKQKEEAELQREIIEEAHREITDSIAYAKRIQSAILPPEKITNQYLNEHFILYEPKDVVAGDFYWLESHKDGVSFAAADCTGHGVPGAMVSVVCNSALNRSVREFNLTEPGKILDKTRALVIEEFRAGEKDNSTVKDGMDIALCTLKGNTLMYAGAHNPLWIIRDGEVFDASGFAEGKAKTIDHDGKHFLEIKADKQPIGQFDNASPFNTQKIELKSGDQIYLFSDGYVDQFGGEKGKKFKAKSLRELLLKIADKPMVEQKQELLLVFNQWKGSLEQVDDVCVIGVKI